MLGGNTYARIVAIAPDDNANLDPLPHGLYVGVTGTLVVESMGGPLVTFVAVPAGTLLPIQVRKVKATGTSASSIVGLIG